MKSKLLVLEVYGVFEILNLLSMFVPIFPSLYHIVHLEKDAK
ncbi:MAG: hypothetical protein AB1650_01470 [Candidatus Omnitrophota bacterium]